MDRNASDTARATLRAQHDVRVVRAPEEGSAAADLPRGVFGFTGSPGLAAPLFAERRYRNFEIHHRHDGSVAIVGFVTPADAQRLRSAHDEVAVTIYPDLEGDATELIAIPYEHIVHHRQYSVRNAPGFEARVRSAAPV